MLAAHLQETDRREAWQAYVAQMLWYANNCAYGAHGQKFDHPTWLDMIKPKTEDKRSGMEILQEVKERAKALLKKRKGGK